MRRSEVGQDRRLGTCLASTHPGGFGFPSGPKGSATVSWLDGDRRAARNRQEPSPRKNGPGSKRTRRRNVERRCRVPLFPGDPGNKPRPLPKVRLSASRPPSFSRGEKDKTQLAQWRGNEAAWLFEI